MNSLNKELLFYKQEIENLREEKCEVDKKIAKTNVEIRTSMLNGVAATEEALRES